MLVRMLLLFVLFPLADLVLLLIITEMTSVWLTVGLVLVAGVVGIWLARRQWRRIGIRARERLAQNQLPGELASDAIIVLIAAILLITPGLMTDVIGISLLIPACRRWYKIKSLNWLKKRFQMTLVRNQETSWRENDDVIDGDYRPVNSESDSESRPMGRLPR